MQSRLADQCLDAVDGEPLQELSELTHLTDERQCQLLDGPDTSDDGLALCPLHHELVDRGVLGLDDDMTVAVTQRFSARTPHGRAVYQLHGRRLAPRPGTPLPAEQHVAWHRQQVVHGAPLIH